MSQTIGERITLHAKMALGWGHERLASELGVSYETVRKWMSGDTAPTRSRAKDIAAKLGKSVEWVMHGTTPDEAVVSEDDRRFLSDLNLLPSSMQEQLRETVSKAAQSIRKVGGFVQGSYGMQTLITNPSGEDVDVNVTFSAGGQPSQSLRQLPGTVAPPTDSAGKADLRVLNEVAEAEGQKAPPEPTPRHRAAGRKKRAQSHAGS